MLLYSFLCSIFTATKEILKLQVLKFNSLKKHSKYSNTLSISFLTLAKFSAGIKPSDWRLGGSCGLPNPVFHQYFFFYKETRLKVI